MHQNKTTGLTLGKFAPLHKGHQLVIETALREVDHLIIMIYDTDVTTIPLQVRVKWIKCLYPNSTVIECWDGPEGYGSERSFEILQEEYILKMLNGRKISHFYSSEFYGEHVSEALGAIDRRIDEARIQIPISATQIRQNSHKNKEFISPIVYKDLITKVVFVGAMSTGKTTIAEALAEKYNTSFSPEYGREYWEAHQLNRRIPFEAFDEIAKKHIELEELNILEANNYLFVDTNALTTRMYSIDYHSKCSDFLENLALKNQKGYDLFFLCEDDIPYDDTWDRSGPQKREVFQKKVRADLLERKIPFIPLKGSLEQRIKKVDEVLTRFVKYNNFFGQ
ncbi:MULTISPECIES: AAA family ATPase [unclassified Imperialibacter]|uniref:AAA family ATPase n=1 Tax=unclassified Imperialibacter TaxID=2629706 RepID=UPI0012514252|nr:MULTISPECIES: AAA family ATPase [unclassified Imperialibacter]CAD5299386.1 Cytidyltransferase [Imperialibacter sp. 89]CAD5299972.1 Cytidyltransferase [Imperialibacter sp. 75]VVT15523.1 Cytidyltransferase [Imperialibacter sp. EC-SDR9]